jgi:hypothetical protein
VQVDLVEEWRFGKLVHGKGPSIRG